MLVIGEIYKSSTAFIICSKKPNSDPVEETIRTLRMSEGVAFTVLYTEFHPSNFGATDRDDYYALEDRLYVSILYERSIWWVIIPTKLLYRYQRIVEEQ